MGHYYSSRSEQLRAEAEAREERKKEEEVITQLAAKVVMVIIDEVNRVIVRPGPDAEERECYQMAQEIRDIDERLTNLVRDVLKVSLEEKEVMWRTQ